MGDINLPSQNIGQKVPESGGTMISNLKNLKAGAGQPIKSTTDGFFIGGESFASAPWAVDYAGKQYIGANGEIVLDGPGKTITVNTGGTITTDFLKDSTYGYNGVFVKQIRTTSNGNINIPIGPSTSGGLLTVQANYKSSVSGQFLWLNPIAHYYVFESAGIYYIYHGGVQIATDINLGAVYYTCLFNSQENSQSYPV